MNMNHVWAATSRVTMELIDSATSPSVCGEQRELNALYRRVLSRTRFVPGAVDDLVPPAISYYDDTELP